MVGMSGTVGTVTIASDGPRRFEALSWDDALDRAEELLRRGGATTVTALSGGESIEEAYGLAKLLRRGLGAHNAVLPEEPSEFGGSPLSAPSCRARLLSVRAAIVIGSAAACVRLQSQLGYM